MGNREQEVAPDNPGVIAPPPGIHLAFILMGVAVQRGWAWHMAPESSLRFALGLSLVVGGHVIVALFFLTFRRAGQNPLPNTPSPAVISTGLYRFSRNPVYSANVVIHVGFALMLDNMWILLFLPPAVVIMHYGVIVREEAYMERTFGEEYLRYKNSVRRWV